ncbi:hypothetical protein TWF481_003837 [Arthrobotrys musiformis]|uniref:Uncharacterized protein n=1 Tax=Arthrobotrys musiformis TaxID=47236 RepID=A0AAV9WHR4_9PEZI
MFKRIRRKPTPGSNNTQSEEAPPPYRYNENATKSTVDIVVKPFATYVENMAVEDVNLGGRRRNSDAVIENSSVDSRENSEVGRGSLNLERYGVDSKRVNWENEGRGARGYETSEGRLPEPPVPPPAPPSRPNKSRGTPPPLPPTRRSNPLPLPPKEPLRTSSPPPQSSETYTEAESTDAVHQTETAAPLPAEEEDDGNTSDASDDSFIVAKRQSLYQQQEFDALSHQKLNITDAVEKEQWDIAGGLLYELVDSMEMRNEKVPTEWYLELIRLSLKADTTLGPNVLRHLPSTSKNKSVEGESDEQRKLRAECMAFQGILNMGKDDEVSVKWFLKGSKFARKHGFTEEMDFCYWMLKQYHQNRRNSKEVEVYEASLTPGYDNVQFKEYFNPRVFRSNVTPKALKQEECLRRLDQLISRKDVAEDESKKEKYRNVLRFVASCHSRDVDGNRPSCSAISDIYGFGDDGTELLQLINSADSIFKILEGVNSKVQVELRDPLFCSIICRNEKSPTATHDYFSADESLIISDILQIVLSFMNRHLVEDICQLKSYGIAKTKEPPGSNWAGVISKSIPDSLKSACCQWLYYLLRSGAVVPSSELQIFLEEHWLHWLEVLGILGELDTFQQVYMSSGMFTRGDRQTLEAKLGSLPPALVKKILGLDGFLKRYASELMETPLQVYYLWRIFEFEEGYASPSTSKVAIKVETHDTQDQDATAKALQEGYKELLSVIKPGADSRQKVVFSSDLRLVAYNVPDSPIVIVKDLMKKSPGVILEHGQKQVYEIYFSPQVAKDNTLGLITDPTQLTLWDISTGTQKIPFYPESRNGHLRICFSPDGKLIALLSSRRSISVRSTVTGDRVWNVVNSNADIASMAFRPDSSELAMIGGYYRLMKTTPKAKSLTELSQLSSWYYAVSDAQACVEYLNREESWILAWIAREGVFIVKDGGKEKVQLEANIPSNSDGIIKTAIASPNGRRVAVIEHKKGIRIYDAATGKRIKEFWRLGQMFGETTLAAAFLPSGDRLITVSKEMGMRVWELTPDLEVEDGWVVRGVEKIMRVPKNYHARIADAERSNTVVLTHLSGRVLEIEFGINKGRVVEATLTTGAYGLVSSVISYLPSLPRRLPTFGILGS